MPYSIKLHTHVPQSASGWTEISSDRGGYRKYSASMSGPERQRILIKIIALSVLSAGTYFVYLLCTEAGRQDLSNLRKRTFVHYVALVAAVSDLKQTSDRFIQNPLPGLSSSPSVGNPNASQVSSPQDTLNPTLHAGSQTAPPTVAASMEKRTLSPDPLLKPPVLSPASANPKLTAEISTVLPAATLNVSRALSLRPLPTPPAGVIRNGYGEYLIYRVAPTGSKISITEAEYDTIYPVIEECRALQPPPSDRQQHLETKVREKLGKDVFVAFIPRTLYELIYLRQCIQEDIDNGMCCNARETDCLWFIEEGDSPTRLARFDKLTDKCFWQLCLFTDEDYVKKFAPKSERDFRVTLVRKIAKCLNQVALDYFFHDSKKEGFTFKEIKKVRKKMTAFLKELHDPTSDLNASVKQVSSKMYAGLAYEFSEEETCVRGEVDRYPQGIANERHEEIISKAIQLECSLEASNSLILYRGGKFDNDGIRRQRSTFQNDLFLPNSLSFGTSLFAGALYDGGATAFHYMRQQSLDAQAWILPLAKLQEGSTPFHAFNMHALIQLMSRGEIFHGRTKYWKVNPEDKVCGYLGLGTEPYKKIPDCCKSSQPQEELEKSFLEYKSQAFVLSTGIAY